jgi:hypothetical protein
LEIARVASQRKLKSSANKANEPSSGGSSPNHAAGNATPLATYAAPRPPPPPPQSGTDIVALTMAHAAPSDQMETTTTSAPPLQKLETRITAPKLETSLKRAAPSLAPAAKPITSAQDHTAPAKTAKKARLAPSACWGCQFEFGPPERPGRFPERDQLWQRFLVGRETLDIDPLSKVLARFQQKEVYRKELERGELETLPWPWEMVRTHITEHMLDPVIQFKMRLAKVRQLENQCSQNLYRSVVHTTSTEESDIQAAGAMAEAEEPTVEVDHAYVRSFVSLTNLAKGLIREIAEVKRLRYQ